MGDICYAEYCQMLRCPDVLVEQQVYKTTSRCNEKDMEKLRFDCMTMIHACFPKDSEHQEAAHIVQAALCDHLHCSEVSGDIEDNKVNFDLLLLHFAIPLSIIIIITLHSFFNFKTTSTSSSLSL